MPSFNSGPVNIQQGNSAFFTVEFLDSSGSLSVPSSASMSVSYTDSGSSPQVDTFDLTLTGRFFTGTWSSGSAALGVATWTASASPTGTNLATGQLRIIQRAGSS